MHMACWASASLPGLQGPFSTPLLYGVSSLLAFPVCSDPACKEAELDECGWEPVPRNFSPWPHLMVSRLCTILQSASVSPFILSSVTSTQQSWMSFSHCLILQTRHVLISGQGTEEEPTTASLPPIPTCLRQERAQLAVLVPPQPHILTPDILTSALCPGPAYLTTLQTPVFPTALLPSQMWRGTFALRSPEHGTLVWSVSIPSLAYGMDRLKGRPS